MDRFYEVDEYASSSGGLLELIVPLFLLAYAFLFWDGSARLRLTVFLVVLFGVAAYGMSIGNTFGVILFIASIFIALGTTEPISDFIEQNIFEKKSPEVGLKEEVNSTGQGSCQILSKKSADPNKKTEDPTFISHSKKNFINDISDPVSAYDLGFETRLNSKQMHIFQSKGTSRKVRESYERGYNDGCRHVADLLNIKTNAVSELDLFLTLLHAFEANLVSEHISDKLEVIFNEAFEKRQISDDYEDDLNQHDEVDFVISEIDKFLCRRK